MNFINNTNVPNSKPFIGITIPTPAIAGIGTPNVINQVALFGGPGLVIGNMQRFSVRSEVVSPPEGIAALIPGAYTREPFNATDANITYVEPSVLGYQKCYLANVPNGWFVTDLKL